jgi:hypothetical protein
MGGRTEDSHILIACMKIGIIRVHMLHSEILAS